MKTITAMEFRKSPGEFFYEVRRRRQSFLITYMGKPTAKLVPVDDAIVIQSDGTILGEKPVTMGADGARLLGDVHVAKFDDADDEIIYPTLVPKRATFAEVEVSFDIDAIYMRVIRNNAPPEVFKQVESTFPVEAGTFIEISFKPMPKRPASWSITWLRE